MVRNLLLAAALTATSVAGVIGTNAPSVEALDDTPWRLPVTPPRCTVSEAESGDVAGCLLAFYGDPAETGWGVPPAPGVGEGWQWLGYTYNGSPALAGWERTYIAENDAPVAGLSAGRLETHVAVQALFEGFLAEIAARGYRVRDASGYSFRCTSGNGGWSCPSGDPHDLSNHAWGLAIDMNAGTNPIRSYSGIDGATACATPIETDLPRWVIQTAEKWGLYWGGYGWNSGCADTTTRRTIVYRDPPHFEFRGTPRQAQAIAEFNLRNDPSVVCITIVDDRGNDVERCSRDTAVDNRPPAATRLPVQLDPPPGAAAAMINLTATGAATNGFLTLESCGPQPTTRTTSALIYTPGSSIATMAIVPFDDDGRFCVYRSAHVHSIVDVIAYLGTDGEPLWFDADTPTRLKDTRADRSCAPSGACWAGRAPGGSEVVIPTDDAAPRLANVVAVRPDERGYLQAGRCGTLGPTAEFSNLNFVPAAVRANLVVLHSGEAGSCAFALRDTDLVVDELGRLDPEVGYGWSLVESRRVLDTRECTAAWCGGRPGAGRLIRLDVGTTAPGAAIAITTVLTGGSGFVTAGLCADLDRPGTPATSNLNYAPDGRATNLALVELEEGEMCLYTSAAAHLIVDVQAELVDDQVVGLLPVDPTRVHDSRNS
jgi:hypothetical protein